MFDIFLSWRKSFSREKSCFLKKPLVALTLLVLVSMCLSIAEAAPTFKNHRRPHLDMDTKDSHPANPSTSLNPHLRHYKNAINKITKRLKNTKTFFHDGFRELNDSMTMPNGKPAWLPKMNFSNIYIKSKNYKSLKLRLTFLMPKLYKHLKEYRMIFERLQNVSIVSQEDMYDSNIRRHKFLALTIDKLKAFITDVTDAMGSIKMPTPKFYDSKFKMNLETLKMKVDGTQCSVQDHIAYRGYKNLLSNWNLTFKCRKKNKGKILEKKCQCYANRYASNNKTKGRRRPNIPCRKV